MKPSPDAHEKLQKCVDAVVKSYSLGRAVDNLESAALPNRRKVAEAVMCFKHMIYMGFYSTRELNQHNLNQHVGAHMHDAFEILVEQISRAVAYSRLGGCAPERQDVEWSENVVLEIFCCLPDVREKVARDVDAAYEGDPAAQTVEEIIFSYPAVEAITIQRVAHEFYKRKVPLIPRIMAEEGHAQTGIDIHPGAQIGDRFFIDHGTGVVIGETTVIGDNVKVYQGVTLGAVSIRRDAAGDVIRGLKRHPTIEDDVTIYSGATILGGDTVIGKGSVIGGNVWLTKSVPPDTRVTYSMPEPGNETQTEEPVRQKARSRSDRTG